MGLRKPQNRITPAVPEAEAPDWDRVLEQLQGGQPAAFLRFNRLVTGCLLQLRAYDFEEEWDDLRQEVLAAVLQTARSGRLRERAAFVGYVRSITRNKVMDRIKRRIRHQEKQTLPWEQASAALYASDSGCEADPELRHDLENALAQLPEAERRLVVGVYVEGRTYPEMAAHSGVPLGTLKRRLRQGLARLRVLLGEAGAGDPKSSRAETHGS